MRPAIFLLIFILLGLLAGCSGQMPAAAPLASLPTPTALPLFADSAVIGVSRTVQASPSTSSGIFASAPAAAVYPTLTPFPTATYRPTQPQPPGPIEAPVYTDALSDGWQVVSLDNEMSFDLKSKAQVHSGANSIAITPNKGHGKIYIVAGPNNRSVYPRTQVLGIRFWLYSGERGLDQYDLALTAIGSNTFTYWRADDYSVISKTPYEETFLRWFGYDKNIAPFTWAPVQIWLNDMRFDPDYQYVTGLYITNRQGFTRTFYIDDISLQLQPDTAQNTAQNTAQSTLTPTPTP